MKKIVKLFLFVLVVTIFISGCSSSKPTLTVYNWGDYIDEDVISEFEKEFGVRVVYDEFATNEDMYVKINAGGGNYDVAFPSDYMIKRMIDEELLHKINFANVTNYKYIDEQFKGLGYDPSNEYSVPYMWGTVGILYNKTMVKEPVNSWKILWDSKYSKQILMLDSQRDSIGITLKMLGYSLNTKNPQELEKAKDALIEQKPLVLAYVGDEVKDKMISGEAALAVVWSGDAVYMMRENSELAYAIPDEGSNLWFDAMVIPKTSKNKELAEKFIDFMTRTDIAFKNTDYIGYSTPHTEAKAQLDPDLINDEAAYPLIEDLKNSEVFEDLSSSASIYDRIWTEVKAK